MTAIHLSHASTGWRSRAPPGTVVAAAVEIARARRTARASRAARPAPAALCGMGICGECRVAIDGQAHRSAARRCARRAGGRDRW